MVEYHFFFPRVAAADTPRQVLERRTFRSTRNLLTRAAAEGVSRRLVSNRAGAR